LEKYTGRRYGNSQFEFPRISTLPPEGLTQLVLDNEFLLEYLDQVFLTFHRIIEFAFAQGQIRIAKAVSKFLLVILEREHEDVSIDLALHGEPWIGNPLEVLFRGVARRGGLAAYTIKLGLIFSCYSGSLAEQGLGLGLLSRAPG